MALKVYELKALADSLSLSAGQRVGKIIQYAKDVFSFRLQRSGRLIIALDNQNPLVFLSDEERGGASLSTPASALLRKKLSGAEFLGAEVLNNDRVLSLRFLTVNDIFEEEPLSLVLELIPTKANMAMLDANGKVLLAFRSNTITDPRPLFHGVTYEPPLKKANLPLEEGEFDVEAYYLSCKSSLEKIQEHRKTNLYQSFFKEAKARIKSLKRKIVQIDQDVEKGQLHLHDSDYGNYLFTYPEAIEEGADHFDYCGTRVSIDPLKSAKENANDFFKKAKKAKNAIALGEENKARALKELEEEERLLEFAKSCDEETLVRMLGDANPKASKSKKVAPQKKRGPLPFIAQIADRYYYFGKSAKQNDYLSFLYATKGDYLWFHVKNQHGSHVILPHSNPTNEEITHACELALLSTGLTSGEVQYTEHRNIRKGSVPGQVIIGSYRSAYIKSISVESSEAYLAAIAKGDRP